MLWPSPGILSQKSWYCPLTMWLNTTICQPWRNRSSWFGSPGGSGPSGVCWFTANNFVGCVLPLPIRKASLSTSEKCMLCGLVCCEIQEWETDLPKQGRITAVRLLEGRLKQMRGEFSSPDLHFSFSLAQCCQGWEVGVKLQPDEVGWCAGSHLKATLP